MAAHPYDALTRRTTKANAAETRAYYYDRQWRAIEERAASDVVASYVWSPLDRWTMIRRSRPVTGEAPEQIYVLKDYLDPAAVIDTSAAVVERFGYDAFGPVRFMDDGFETIASSAVDWNFLFHAEFLDTDSGLYNYGYRYYHPELGRWVSRDPIEEEGGFNLYGFVQNSGTNKIDVLGLSKCPKSDCCIGGTCDEDPCKKGGILVGMGSIYLRLQLIDRLLHRRHGGPGGSVWNRRPNDSCYNQSSEMIGGQGLDKNGNSTAIDVPECWTCMMEGGSRLLGTDHFWIRCYANNCQGKVVDTLVLDYWAAGDPDFYKKFPYPPDPTTYPDPIVGPRPPCSPKWR